MNLKELVDLVVGKIRCAKEVGSQLCKEHSESENTLTFVKTAFSRDILERKERHVPAAITTWLLLLLIFGNDGSTVFLFGILPLLVYYILKVLKETPEQ
jgi:hypothetical protein